MSLNTPLCVSLIALKPSSPFPEHNLLESNVSRTHSNSLIQVNLTGAFVNNEQLVNEQLYVRATAMEHIKIVL